MGFICRNGFAGIFVENKFCNSEFNFIGDELVGYSKTENQLLTKSSRGFNGIMISSRGRS